MHHDVSTIRMGDPGLGAKVKFLSGPDAYPGHAGPVNVRETHMSWVFLVGDRPSS